MVIIIEIKKGINQKKRLMIDTMKKVLIVGGGAAGMAAAIGAGRNNHQVAIYEKNEKLGKKIYITGKGRCNITNASDMETILANVVTNKKFLYSAFYGFTNEDMIQLLESAGCKTKVERGNRVFPVSDKASDVIQALSKEMRKLDVDIHLRTKVISLIIEDNVCKGIMLEGGEKVYSDAVIVCTGGLSYHTTGSTGDGYEFAKECGHTITELSPALVPFNAKEDWVRQLQGLSLKNVQIQMKQGKKVLYEDFGEMLFTHYGVSGPAVLSGSSVVAKKIKKQPVELVIDLKPALSEEQLDARMLREFDEFKNKQFKNSLSHLYPSKLIPIMIQLSGINPEKKVNEISKEERHGLVHLTKNLVLTLHSLRDYNEAIITQGGISVKEVNPTTMESKLIPNLYFAGEVLDLDAFTGGYNLQIAWSTGYAAGNNIV